MVELCRVALGGAGIGAAAKSNRPWRADGGPGNRSGILNVYLGASANELASWQLGRGRHCRGQAERAVGRWGCTGHLKLWLSIQLQARGLSSPISTRRPVRSRTLTTILPYPRHFSRDLQPGPRLLQRAATSSNTSPPYPNLTPSPGRVALGRIHHGQEAHPPAPCTGAACEESEQAGGQPMCADHVVSSG